MKTIYLDHAATTKLNKTVLEKMLPYLTDVYGNANSLHSIGRLAVKGLDDARDEIASLLNVKPNEIYFTSGGTEGDNWALRGITAANKDKGNKVVITDLEHAAMQSTALQLKNNGIDFSYAHTDKNGFITPEEFKSKFSSGTILSCCMYANNEVGTIQPIRELSKIAHENGAYFFTDAVQAAGAVDIDVKAYGIDMMSVSAHKFGGPKGKGFCYIRSGVKILPLISGGHQERMKRGGTSDVAGAVGVAEAFKLAKQNMEKDSLIVTELRNVFIDKVLNSLTDVKLNGDRLKRLPNNASLTFKGISGEALLCQLDLKGICASLGAACSAGSVEPSAVLRAMGLSDDEAMSTLRFTFGTDNTLNEVNYAADTLIECVNKLRKF